MKKVCKNCQWRGTEKNPRNCQCPKIHEKWSGEENINDDCMAYSYDEGGWFEVGDNFGCVHFESTL